MQRDSPPLSVRYLDEQGRSLFIDTAIKKGDLVLIEKPALLLPGNPSIPERIDALLDPKFDSLRQHLWAPDPSSCDLLSHPVLRVLRLMAKSYSEPSEALRCALYWHINAFSFGDNTALFFQASLFAHSCTPNTAFDVVDDSMHFRALGDLSPGDLLTISYLPPVVELQDQRQRNDKLWREKCFHCQCKRCVMDLNMRREFNEESIDRETLVELEDEISIVAQKRSVTNTPLSSLCNRAQLYHGEQHWTFILTLLLELQISDQTTSSSSLYHLRCVVSWTLGNHHHLLYPLLFSLLSRFASTLRDDEEVMTYSNIIKLIPPATLIFPHHQQQLQKLASLIDKKEGNSCGGDVH